MNVRLAAFIAAITLAASASATPRIHPNVHRALRREGTVNLIVTMKEDIEKPLESIDDVIFDSRGARITQMVNNLKEHNNDVTASLVDVLNAGGPESDEPTHGGYQNFWISNQVFIADATPALIEKLQSISSVDHVREEIVIPLEKPVIEEVHESLIGHEWNIDRVQAPKVWEDGIFGQNVLVANIDTGVRYTHEALDKNWVRDYGWFDPEGLTELPFDNAGHGTHTMGTIAGGKGIGVAPGVKWAACKGCGSESCSERQLLACAQWVTCPTNTRGDEPNCSKAPRVVSNSWGGGQGEDWYSRPVKAWHKAGIIPVFANGNEGPGCMTVSSPGDYPNVIGVGATTIEDKLASFSSKGPSVKGVMKPDISAPGHRVRSAWNGNDKDYLVISGTSMATPHVSGAVALLLSREPSLKYDDIKKKLFTTTDQDQLVNTNYICGGYPDIMWPNNQYGYGRLNAFSAHNGTRQESA